MVENDIKGKNRLDNQTEKSSKDLSIFLASGDIKSPYISNL